TRCAPAPRSGGRCALPPTPPRASPTAPSTPAAARASRAAPPPAGSGAAAAGGRGVRRRAPALAHPPAAAARAPPRTRVHPAPCLSLLPQVLPAGRHGTRRPLTHGPRGFLGPGSRGAP